MENDVILESMNLDDVDCKLSTQNEMILIDHVVVKVINESLYDLPAYGTPGSAGMDLRANITEPYQLDPGQIKLFPTGIKISLPKGYEMQIRPRSGLALKRGITVLNSPGTIDSDYINEVGVILINLGSGPVVINPGDRIAQAVVARYSVVEWELVTELEETERKGGFGHTGIN